MNAPTSVTIRLLGPSENHILDNVAADVFDNAIDVRWAAEYIADPRHHLAVALDADCVVGMASAVHYVHPDKAPELWINEVGVAPDYRQQGIGKALLNALFEHGRTLKCAEAWVLTETDNTTARRLYASAGGEEEERPVYITFKLDTSA